LWRELSAEAKQDGSSGNLSDWREPWTFINLSRWIVSIFTALALSGFVVANEVVIMHSLAAEMI
jgi:hypothetical protein